MPIAYDLGKHDGDDTHDYLSKGDEVVSVEAPSALFRAVPECIASELSDKHLTILDLPISDKKGEIAFYLHWQEMERVTIVKHASVSAWTTPQVETAPQAWRDRACIHASG